MARRPWHARLRRPSTLTPDRPDVEGSADAGSDPVELRLAHLEREATAAVGGASLCAISRSAGSVPAAKYLEGRLAALMALRRSMRRGERLRVALAEHLDEWRGGLEDATVRDAGPDWRAYRAGGVDELEEFAARHAGPDA